MIDTRRSVGVVVKPIVVVAGVAMYVIGLGLSPAFASEPISGSVDEPEIYIQVQSEKAYGGNAPTVDRLAARSVLRIVAVGFEPNTTGTVEQCSADGCANPFPVTFDIDGTARLEYLVNDSFARGFDRPTTCRADEQPCVVHVHSDKGSAFLRTVFRDATPAPRRVSLRPNAGRIANNAPVLVAVTGFVPGERVEAMLCAAPASFGSKHCGAPGPVAPFTIEADGTGRVAMKISTGHVGTGGASCGRSARCSVVVSPPRASIPGAVLPITFAAGPGARYDGRRLLAGLSVAVLLAALAIVITRTTDWRKPTEADTPELDRAVLTD